MVLNGYIIVTNDAFGNNNWAANNTGAETLAKRIAISLDEEQVKLLDSIDGFGTKEAEKVKNILLAYLSEKGYLDKFNKVKKGGSDEKK